MPTKKTTAKKTSRRTLREDVPIIMRNQNLTDSGALGKAWDNLKKIAVDLTTVDVTTFQGDVTIEVESDGNFNPSAFYAKLQGKIKEGSTLTLVAHTHVTFDLDSVVIIKPDADAKLMEVHNKAVQTAVDARLSVVNFVKTLALGS